MIGKMIVLGFALADRANAKLRNTSSIMLYCRSLPVAIFSLDDPIHLGPSIRIRRFPCFVVYVFKTINHVSSTGSSYSKLLASRSCWPLPMMYATIKRTMITNFPFTPCKIITRRNLKHSTRQYIMVYPIHRPKACALRKMLRKKKEEE